MSIKNKSNFFLIYLMKITASAWKYRCDFDQGAGQTGAATRELVQMRFISLQNGWAQGACP